MLIHKTSNNFFFINEFLNQLLYRFLQWIYMKRFLRSWKKAESWTVNASEEEGSSMMPRPRRSTFMDTPWWDEWDEYLQNAKDVELLNSVIFLVHTKSSYLLSWTEWLCFFTGIRTSKPCGIYWEIESSVSELWGHLGQRGILNWLQICRSAARLTRLLMFFPKRTCSKSLKTKTHLKKQAVFKITRLHLSRE